MGLRAVPKGGKRTKRAKLVKIRERRESGGKT